MSAMGGKQTLAPPQKSARVNPPYVNAATGDAHSHERHRNVEACRSFETQSHTQENGCQRWGGPNDRSAGH